MGPEQVPSSAFNPLQKQGLLFGCLDVHQRMAELEALLIQAEQPTMFTRYVSDLSPVEQRVLRDYFARIREVMSSLLRAHDVPLKGDRISLRWTATTALSFLQVAVAEISPGKLRGYGELAPEGKTAALRMQQELARLLDQAAQALPRDSGSDFAGRMAQLEASIPDLVQTLHSHF